MDLLKNKEIKEVKSRLLQGMLEFIKDDENADYSPDEVDQCDSILKDFLLNASKLDNKDAFIQEVRKTVLALNDLNEKVDCSIIETDQREDICDILIYSGFLLGFNKKDEDITEEWREW
ncbi:MAG TPA: hypothetical protein PKK43_07795 [Spirochaetota bacterium]|nr:hypothetical protein [Spirochaetota bacterium]